MGEAVLSGPIHEIVRLMRRKSRIQRLERRLDRYNHIMELVRTIVPIAVLVIQLLILYKLGK